MQGKLLPLPLLVLVGASWLLGLWLAILPVQSNASLIRILRLESFPYVGAMLRIVGGVWVLVLAVGFWLSMRPYHPR